MLILEGRGEPVKSAVVSLEELMAHACGHLNCNGMLGGVRQMYRAHSVSTSKSCFVDFLSLVVFIL